MTFKEKLGLKWKEEKYLCPELVMTPGMKVTRTQAEMFTGYVRIIDTTLEHVCAYTIDTYTCIGKLNEDLLKEIIDYIRSLDPGMPVILKCIPFRPKENTEAFDIEAALTGLDADAIIPSCDWTEDFLAPLVQKSDKGFIMPLTKWDDQDFLVYDTDLVELSAAEAATVKGFEVLKTAKSIDDRKPYFIRCFQEKAITIDRTLNTHKNCGIVLESRGNQRKTLMELKSGCPSLLIYTQTSKSLQESISAGDLMGDIPELIFSRRIPVPVSSELLCRCIELGDEIAREIKEAREGTTRLGLVLDNG